LLFVSFIPHRHFQIQLHTFLLARASAVAQGAQLGPGDLRVDAAAQAAVGAARFPTPEFPTSLADGAVLAWR